jgi:diaminopimelate epimerase
MRGETTTGFLEKWHGAGNDFLVAVRPTGPARLDGEAARRWCDRHTGLGADGLIEGTFDERGLVMHLHNADGTPAELSGNGLRCLVAAAASHGLVPEGTLDVATDAGARRVTIALDAGGDRAWGSV